MVIFMEKSTYVKFDVPKELEDKALELLEIAKDTGKVKKGINETTKVVERGQAVLVYLSEDVEPMEVAAHLPLLCEEKNIPYVYSKSQKDLGAACGITVGCGACAIIDAGKAKSDIEPIVGQIQGLK